MLVLAVQKIVCELWRLRQTLNARRHEASVAQIAQTNHTALFWRTILVLIKRKRRLVVAAATTTAILSTTWSMRSARLGVSFQHTQRVADVDTLVPLDVPANIVHHKLARILRVVRGIHIAHQRLVPFLLHVLAVENIARSNRLSPIITLGARPFTVLALTLNANKKLFHNVLFGRLCIAIRIRRTRRRRRRRCRLCRGVVISSSSASVGAASHCSGSSALRFLRLHNLVEFGLEIVVGNLNPAATVHDRLQHLHRHFDSLVHCVNLLHARKLKPHVHVRRVWGAAHSLAVLLLLPGNFRLELSRHLFQRVVWWKLLRLYRVFLVHVERAAFFVGIHQFHQLRINANVLLFRVSSASFIHFARKRWTTAIPRIQQAPLILVDPHMCAPFLNVQLERFLVVRICQVGIVNLAWTWQTAFVQIFQSARNIVIAFVPHCVRLPRIVPFLVDREPLFTGFGHTFAQTLHQRPLLLNRSF
mmetsp:Transcript_17960/g.28373  ORF Transcript_17960/g.28373 Transcript_17960/m.28373 type:complete len:475 (-) Transcript_17960:251-1675(-)